MGLCCSSSASVRVGDQTSHPPPHRAPPPEILRSVLSAMILASSAPSDITTAVTNPSPLASSSFVSSDPETLRRLRRGLQRSVAWELEVATLLQSKAQPHHPQQQEPLLHQHNKTGGGRGQQNVVLRPKPTTRDVLSEQSRDVHDRTAPRQGRDGSAIAEAASSRQLAYVAVLDGAVVQHWLGLLEGKRGGGDHEIEDEGANHPDDPQQGRGGVGAEADFGGDVGASVIFSPQKGSGGAAAAPSAGGGRSAVRGDVEDNGGIDADAALFQMDEVCATKPRRCGEKGSKQKPKKIRPADKHSAASAPAAAAVDPVVVLWGDVVGVSFDATVDEAVRSLIRSTPLFAALPVSTSTPPLHHGDAPPSPSSPFTSFPFLYVIQPLQTTEEAAAPVAGAASGFAQGNRSSSVECWLRAGSGAVRMEGLVEVSFSTSSMWDPHPQHGGLSEDEARRKGEGVNRHRQQANHIHRCVGEKREQEWNAFVKDDAEEREAEMETLHAQIQQLKEIRKGI